MRQQNFSRYFGIESVFENRKRKQEEDVKRLSQHNKFHVTVDKIIFKNAEGNFFIVALSSKKPKGEFTAKTTYPMISEGGVYDMEGKWEEDRKYGLQFIAKNVKEAVPDTMYGMERYLSENIDGLGVKSAHLVVSAFGVNTQRILDSTPEKLYKIKGLNRKQVQKAIKSWNERKDVNVLYTYLTSIHVNTGNCNKIFEKYGNKSIEKIKENPYCLTDIEGIGFTTADNIAKELGVKTDNPFRLRSGIIYTLDDDATSNGHSYMTREQLVKASMNLLGVSDQDKIEDELDYLITNFKLVEDHNSIYTQRMYNAETTTAAYLVELINGKTKTIEVSNDLGKTSGIEYDDIQMDAIKTAMASKVMVLTGGPGTGKTTTTKGIIAAWKEAGMNILLAAPTGRAAKRLSEATGMAASTIHRLLGFQGGQFMYNEENPLEGDALIIDEASMIDINLMAHLVKALPKNMRLVLVGDVDQLPSVGPGNVLRDCIDSGVVPVVRLTRIFRQAQNSRIITNAHLIDEGKPILFDNSKGSDFFFIQDDNNENITKKVVGMVTTRLPKYYSINPKEIQVLTPMKKSNNGVQTLNKLLQAAINPSGEELHYGTVTFRVGDKVMQMKNNYDKDVFNGDMGEIVEVNNSDGTLLVDFGKKHPVEYGKKDLANLSLSYACTIHKSQGSEYPIVVMPFTMQFYIMLQRNLLYTGVTRAKKVCVIIGDKKAVSMAIRNGKTAKRNTRLKERLRRLTKYN